MKTFDEKGFKEKFGKQDKQNLLPPSYLRKRGYDHLKNGKNNIGLEKID